MEAEAPGGRPAVTFVATEGTGSLDKYSQKLAEHLPVPKLYTDAYSASSKLFNAPLLARASLRGMRQDLSVARLLSAQRAVLHLPTQHLGRYAHALRHPYVVTVHDLIRHCDMRASRGRPALMNPPSARDRLYLRLDYAAVRRARAVIAVSHSTKRDLVQHLGLAEDKVFVVYEGIDHSLLRPVEHRVVDGPYVLFVGSEHPRKNFIGLLEAFRALRRDPRHRALKLVKIGSPGGPEAAFRARTLAAVRELGLERNVALIGRVEEAELPAYYSGADCLVLPSLAEGFGLPPLEAMACGCPVIVSEGGSLAEVAGGAALLIDPRDPASLVGGLRELLGDPCLRRELRERGLERAREFSWERAASETVEVYERVFEGSA